jgi:arabinan endo-1,5-alpha-L-arabinosidase
MTRVVRYIALLSVLAVCAALIPAYAGQAQVARRPGTYHNPLRPVVSKNRTVDSCADPTVLRGRGAQARTWYMWCTTDPLNDSETRGTTTPTFHPVPSMRSTDLVHWRYIGDALEQKPSWAAPGASIWAPDVVYSRTFHRYYMTFVVTDTADSVSGVPGCTSDNAIGVATSAKPTGPWVTTDQPLVAPRQNGDGCNFFWTFDPDVLGNVVTDHSVIYYGSYYGGVSAQRVTLTADGMSLAGAPAKVTRGQQQRPKVDPKAMRGQSGLSIPGRAAATPQQIAIGNRYEGSNVVRHGGWYYFFGSASNCCNGPLTGYSVFSGRSRSPLGPFVDREGNSLLAGRVGGTPVLSMNGNRWIGGGHNTVFRDFGGQWWTVYHAVDSRHPYFADQPGFTKRPALLDPLDWVNGWPSVRSGRFASDRRMPAPAAQPGQRSAYRPHAVRRDRPGALLRRFSDEFAGTALDPRWSWVRPPAADTYSVAGGLFTFHTQAADLSSDTNTASVLTEPAPTRGNYVLQTKVRLDVPPEGCCHNFVQAGVLLYGSDDAFIKLVHVSIFETRQTEFAKEVWTAPAKYPRYGNTLVGPPGDVTWLRIVKRTHGGGHYYTAYTSQDGAHWVRGGTWRHDRLGQNVRIGLVSMGASVGDSNYTAQFDHVRVWALRH